MARTLRLVFALVFAVIGGLLIAPAAHAAGTNTVVFHVTDPDGAPIAFTGWIYVGGNGSGNNGTGDLTWNNVDDGDYYFAASAASMDGSSLWYDGTTSGTLTKPATTTHLAGGQTLTITMQFPRLATLSGTVTTDVGDPLPNVSVSFNRLGSVHSTSTDSNGHYTFGYVRAGSITVSTGSSGAWVRPDPVQVTIPSTGDITQNFALTAGASIEGTITNAANSAPLAGLTVAAYTMPTQSFVNSAKTDATGHFHIDGLAGATYALHFDDPLGGLHQWWWSGNAGSSGSATTKAVAVSSQVTWNEAVTYPNPADGTHSLAGTVSDTNSAPLAGIVMTASDGSTSLQTTTDRNGRWALGTADGSWTIRAEASGVLQSMESATPWYPQYYASAGVADSAAQATLVPVSGNTTDGLDVKLSRSARVKVAVSVTGSSDSVTPTWLPYTTDGTALPAAPTDYQGNPLLRPGSYKLLVTGEANGNPLLPRWYGNGASLGAAPTLTLAAGEDATGSAVALSTSLIATSAPAVPGYATVGRPLSATTAGWNLETGTTSAGRWTRNGVGVGTGLTYQPVAADVGANLQYTVTATNAAFGHTFTTSISIPVKVGHVSKTTIKAKAVGGKKVRLTVTVSGTVRATGRVTIRRGGVVVGTAKLSKGKATFTAKRQPKGRQDYQAQFPGSATLATSTSRTVRVRVR